MPETFLDTRQVARWLRYKEETLRQWRSNGIGPPYIRVLGKLIRYRASDVERWMVAVLPRMDEQVQQTNGQKKPGRPRKLQRRRIRLKLND